jgi:catechol 2,3-dioxygenase-like lactoylglutathione lyase family enzyme
VTCRGPLRTLVLAALVLLAGSRPAVGQHGPLVTEVAAVGYTVSDLDRAVAFYTEVLGFQAVRETEVVGAEVERLTGVFGARARIAAVQLGGAVVELSEYLAPEGRPLPAGVRSNDRSFQHIAIVVSNLDSAYRVLRRHKVRHASTGPQVLPEWNPAAGGIRAFYFKDPDGHFLELIWFPPGKGDPRWQRKDALFLGIDHTAIVVEDTERSLAFYRDLLGLAVGGESWNYGTEQEHLNNVEGASLRITGLRAAVGPGIEFLEYRRPSDGRPYPADARANDLVHWQTTLRVAVPQHVDRLGASGAPLVSRGVAAVPDTAFGFRRGVILRDPDGHALLVVAP